MSRVTLTYIDPQHDDEFGKGGGFVVSHRKGIKLNTSEMMPSVDARLLTQDILEHWDHKTTNSYCQELIALGSALAHRKQDFYNGMGAFGFHSEIGQQLYCLLDDARHIKLPSSANESISELLAGHWEDTLHFVQDEYQVSLHTADKRALRAVAYRFLSRGYNHAEEINKRLKSNYAFGRLFDEMKINLDDLKRLDLYQGQKVNVAYSFSDCTIKLTTEVDIYDKDYENVIGTVWRAL